MDDTTNEPTVIECKDWNEFRKLMSQRFELVSPSIYRGHAKRCWKLSSMFERLQRAKVLDRPRDVHKLYSPGAFEKFRDMFLSRFRFYLTGMPGIDPKDFENDNACWMVGRHFGLITPLLDWSRSPYVAAFFAFKDRLRMRPAGCVLDIGPDPVSIWRLEEMPLSGCKEDLEILWERSRVGIRQRAQQGLFTKLSHPVHQDLESYLGEKNLGSCLFRYDVSSHCYEDALFDLDQMNISYETLFPDLHGAALQANCESRRDYNVEEPLLEENALETVEWKRRIQDNSRNV